MKLASAGSRRRLSLALVGMVAGVVVITAGVGALTSRLSTNAWTVVDDSAAPSLSAVSCTSSSDCWAVGTAVEHASGGSSWTNVAGHIPSGGVLNGIACPASNQCWGVGDVPTNLASSALVEHDSGGAWTIVHPELLSSAGVDYADIFRGISCINTNDCWAVGEAIAEAGLPIQPLIAHYAGSSWHSVEGPYIGGSGGQLNAVTCSNAADCWAVGPSADGPEPLIEHFNGATWTVVQGPTPLDDLGGNLNAVTCAVAAACWAVGSTGTGENVQPLVETYSKGHWVASASPHVTVVGGGELEGIACTSSSECWAVGDLPGMAVALVQGPGTAQSNTSLTQPLIERYSRGIWTVVTGTSTSKGGALLGVTCLHSGACLAVGGTLIEATA